MIAGNTLGIRPLLMPSGQKIRIQKLCNLLLSVVPRPFEGKRKDLAWHTHCLRMLFYPKNLRGSDTIIYSSAHSLCSIIITVGWVLIAF